MILITVFMHMAMEEYHIPWKFFSQLIPFGRQMKKGLIMAHCLWSIRYITARKQTYDLKDLEREPLRYCKCDGKVTFTRPFLMLGKVTFNERVNVLERYCKGDLSITFKTLMALFPKSKVLKGLVSRSVCPPTPKDLPGRGP